jgi:hypothetical protein
MPIFGVCRRFLQQETDQEFLRRVLDVHFVNSLPLLEVARVLKPFIFKGSKLAQDL